MHVRAIESQQRSTGPFTFASLLEVSARASDGLLPRICEKYKRRLQPKTGSEDTGECNPRFALPWLTSYTNTAELSEEYTILTSNGTKVSARVTEFLEWEVSRYGNLVPRLSPACAHLLRDFSLNHRKSLVNFIT